MTTDLVPTGITKKNVLFSLHNFARLWVARTWLECRSESFTFVPKIRIVARKFVFCYRTPDFVDGPFRGPKSLNFPDGKIQRTKTFQKNCVNRFRDKKCVNDFSRQIKCVNHFATKKYIKLQFDLHFKRVCAVFVTSSLFYGDIIILG